MTREHERVDPADLTVICVTYRSREWVVASLNSAVAAAAHAGLSHELIVVDNASDDGTADEVVSRFPGAVVIRNTDNVGFGAANNQAFDIARGAAWLLLNPDAVVEPGAIDALLQALAEDPRLAVAGPGVRGAGIGEAESAGMLPGIRSLAGHFLFLNRLMPAGAGGAFRGFQTRGRPSVSTDHVEWVSGAVMLVRPSAIREVGGFDPSIFMYGEDLDLCGRLLARKWRIGLVPGARASHAIGGSQGPGSTAWLDGIENHLVRQHAARWRRGLCFLIIGMGLAVRALPWRGSGPSAARRAHRVRMRAGAWRALTFARGSLAGRGAGPA
jgi:GT2 family glycosyltransferase